MRGNTQTKIASIFGGVVGPSGHVQHRGVARLEGAERWRVRLNMRGSVAFRGVGPDAIAFRAGVLAELETHGVQDVEIQDYTGETIGFFSAEGRTIVWRVERS